MANRPGTQVILQTAPPPRSAPTDTGVWFVVGLCDMGPVDTPIEIRSLDEFVTKCGSRVSYGLLYDALDVFFREGGTHAYVGRVVGPAAVKASKALNDSGAAVSLNVSAIGPGTAYNAYKVGVQVGTSGGTYQLFVTDASNVVLETSPDLTTQDDAVQWARAYSNYIRVTLGASANQPAVAAAAALVGGTDDRISITDAQWATALALFTRDLGPGQVSAPGQTVSARHLQLLSHAQNYTRVAILDAPDTITTATLTALATTDKASGTGQYGAIFGPWLVVPGVAVGTFRTVPPSPLVAGAIARNDAVYGPNSPAAGDKGRSRFAVQLSQAGWDDTTRNTLNTAGVNVIRNIYGDVMIYGWRSLADPLNNKGWLDLSNVRVLMAIEADANVIGQQFVFALLDGQGHTLSAYGGALTAMLQGYWEGDQLYGATAGEAFSVDVGPQVNTPTTVANNELRAMLAVRPSPMAELVTIIVVNVPVPLEVS